MIKDTIVEAVFKTSFRALFKMKLEGFTRFK